MFEEQAHGKILQVLASIIAIEVVTKEEGGRKSLK
jgi:hypothetical protein